MLITIYRNSGHFQKKTKVVSFTSKTVNDLLWEIFYTYLRYNPNTFDFLPATFFQSDKINAKTA